MSGKEASFQEFVKNDNILDHRTQLDYNQAVSQDWSNEDICLLFISDPSLCSIYKAIKTIWRFESFWYAHYLGLKDIPDI